MQKKQSIAKRGFNRLGLAALIALLVLSVARCGDGGDGGDTTVDGVPTEPAAASLTLTFTAIKTFHFSWSDVSWATHYKLLENPDGISGFTQVGDDIAQGVQTVDHVVPLFARINAQYILQSCNAEGCLNSASVLVNGTLVDSIGYVKASNTDGGWIDSKYGYIPGDWFGYAVSLSADGNTLAVGALRECAAYVFILGDTGWQQQAYVKASNTEASDGFGIAVSLSADGNTLAVGAYQEDSAASGIDGDQADNSAHDAGAVYVFRRSDSGWYQQAYIKASNSDGSWVDDFGVLEFGDNFGSAISLSADGNTLAVGATGEDSAATGIDGDQADNSARNAGAVYVFSRTDSGWYQQAYIKASNTDGGTINMRIGDLFGHSVSLSADGNTLVVGAISEDSAATGIDGDQADNSADDSGAVYVFSRSDSGWNQQAYIKASNTDVGAILYVPGDNFGHSVSLSADGDTLVVGALNEDSAATGIDGDQTDNSADDSGAVYVFSRSDSGWNQQAYIKASNTDAYDVFGNAVSLAADGNILAVGAYQEDSGADGINGNQADNSEESAGAVYVFSRSDSGWNQQAYIKASNSEGVWSELISGDSFGKAVSLSADGNALTVGAYGEDSAATGIDGDQADNSATTSGAAYLY
jgi:hypothetical protein